MLLQGLRLGRLPHARRESRAIERHVGGVEALIGEYASVKALKSWDVGAYDVLHFAAHAVGDEARPERSGPVDSGRLGGRRPTAGARIEARDLDGRIVVLSACYTATGVVLSGEGVLSLARAFFEAGAHAVVGSRWPLRDVDPRPSSKRSIAILVRAPLSPRPSKPPRTKRVPPAGPPRPGQGWCFSKRRPAPVCWRTTTDGSLALVAFPLALVAALLVVGFLLARWRVS